MDDTLKSSPNTRDKDWHSIGNQGFGFYLLAIDGKVPERKFLSQCNHFAEFDFDDIPAAFASGDMLSVKPGNTPEANKDSGKAVKLALCTKMISATPENFIKALDARFTNFEMKVPGMLKVAQWKKIGDQFAIHSEQVQQNQNHLSAQISRPLLTSLLQELNQPRIAATIDIGRNAVANPIEAIVNHPAVRLAVFPFHFDMLTDLSLTGT